MFFKNKTKEKGYHSIIFLGSNFPPKTIIISFYDTYTPLSLCASLNKTPPSFLPSFFVSLCQGHNILGDNMYPVTINERIIKHL